MDHRQERMQRLQKRLSRIKACIWTGKVDSGLTKKEQRTVRAQAKMHIWDEESKYLFHNYC